MSLDRNSLIAGGKQLGLTLGDREIELLSKFIELVYLKNRELNLTRVPIEEAINRNILDSLSLAKFITKEPARIADIGTGAGFPGVPLAIIFPNSEFVLIDSTKKKLVFIEEALSGLGISNVKVIHARAEELGKEAEVRESFDYGIARAVAPLEILIEMILPLVKVGGSMLSMKSSDIAEELKSSEELLLELCKNNISVETLLSENKSVIVAIEKLSATPPRFPRTSLSKRWAKLRQHSI